MRLLLRVHNVCLYAKNRFEKFARIFCRWHKQTTFSDAGFLRILRVKLGNVHKSHLIFFCLVFFFCNSSVFNVMYGFVAPDIMGYPDIIYIYFSTKTYCGYSLEVLHWVPTICFHEEIRKIIIFSWKRCLMCQELWVFHVMYVFFIQRNC